MHSLLFVYLNTVHRCPKGLLYTRCLSCQNRPLTCMDKMHWPGLCNVFPFCISGCDCPKGKVLDQTTGKCVKECQNRCPIEGQVYKLCMDRPGDPATCANGFPLPIKECIHECECLLGQVLNLTGERCVPPEQCL